MAAYQDLHCPIFVDSKYAPFPGRRQISDQGLPGLLYDDVCKLTCPQLSLAIFFGSAHSALADALSYVELACGSPRLIPSCPQRLEKVRERGFKFIHSQRDYNTAAGLQV